MLKTRDASQLLQTMIIIASSKPSQLPTRNNWQKDDDPLFTCRTSNSWKIFIDNYNEKPSKKTKEQQQMTTKKILKIKKSKLNQWTHKNQQY
jgi:hypothetical protein